MDPAVRRLAAPVLHHRPAERPAAAPLHRVPPLSAGGRPRPPGDGGAGHRQRHQRRRQLGAHLRPSRRAGARGSTARRGRPSSRASTWRCSSRPAIWRHERRRAAPWPRLERRRIRRLAELGLPAAGQVSLEFGVFAVVTALAGRLAPATLAAHQIVLNVASVTFMVPQGRRRGPGRSGWGTPSAGAIPAGARRAGWAALALGAAFMSAAALLFVLAPHPILRLFTTDPARDPRRRHAPAGGRVLPALRRGCRRVATGGAPGGWGTPARRWCATSPVTGSSACPSATGSASSRAGASSASGWGCRSASRSSARRSWRCGWRRTRSPRRRTARAPGGTVEREAEA